VGEDQKQHVELARDVAARFNRLFGPVFTVPEPWIRAVGARVMGLDDPTRKMSKSSPGQFHAVRLLDDPKTIRKTVMRAVTDSGADVVFDRERAGLYNLLSIYQSLTGQSPAQIEARFAGKGYGELKKDLADLIVAALDPLQRRYREVTSDPGYIDSVLAASVARLRPIAEATMDAVRRAMGHR
jgi:tryptophanyl-tRNA synthetase